MRLIFSLKTTLWAVMAMGAQAQTARQPASIDVNNQDWGCYDAYPGHPTAAERMRFIEETVPAAQELERGGGPPAAGLVAMASLESGFGWTRTAIFANNLFGWKYTGAKAAVGHSNWVLTCQPASDANNQYIAFRSRSDSITFVGVRLRDSARYKLVTGRYHSERLGGMAAEVAVRRWVTGIAAAGYNPDPRYPGRVLNIANNFLNPSVKVSSENSLYRFSDALSTGFIEGGAASRSAAEAVLKIGLKPAQYMSEHCDETAIRNWPNYEGLAVLRCSYSVTSNNKTLSAIVYLLNPSASNIADRIGHACAAIGLGGKVSCGRGLATWILGHNGGQFPVAGFVIERKQDAGGEGTDPVYLEFRDGTTIQSADRLNFTDHQLTAEGMEHAARAPVEETRVYARIANASREDYHRAGGKEPVGVSPGTDRNRLWPAVVRGNELRAQETGVDDLLTGVAMGMRERLESSDH